MADAAQKALDLLAVYRARLAYAEKVQSRYDQYMSEFDEEVARIEAKRTFVQKEFDRGPEIISTYKEKVHNQFRILKHIHTNTTIKGQRASGKPIRTEAPIEKLMRLRRQMAKLQEDIDNPDGVGINEKPSSRFSKVKLVEGIKFMKERRTGEWFYADAAGGRVYGAFKSFTEARDNASV